MQNRRKASGSVIVEGTCGVMLLIAVIVLVEPFFPAGVSHSPAIEKTHFPESEVGVQRET